MSEFLQKLNNTYFWDIDPLQLDANKSKRLIIERVMNYGNMDEIRLIKKFYGEKEIADTLSKINYIDPKTLNFISVLFQIPKTKFKCYTRKQLHQPLWNS